MLYWLHQFSLITVILDFEVYPNRFSFFSVNRHIEILLLPQRFRFHSSYFIPTASEHATDDDVCYVESFRTLIKVVVRIKKFIGLVFITVSVQNVKKKWRVHCACMPYKCTIKSNTYKVTMRKRVRHKHRENACMHRFDIYAHSEFTCTIHHSL